MEYKPLFERKAVRVQGQSGSCRTDFSLYEGSDQSLYWSTKPEHIYTPLGVPVSDVEVEHIDDILARVIRVVLKEEIEPQQAGRLNRNLAEQVLSYLGQA
ncbi:hypothetical protein HYU22_04990 [Candidatus Woesearchaeota archaeon]|nr:hypothetical protein [Candidatus Woesearchaeota archaeon]